MTALTAMLALIPILAAPHEPGRELLYPVAVVIFGGLCSGTVLNLALTPVLFGKISGWSKK
jgi:HME family heavy-metal exporter